MADPQQDDPFEALLNRIREQHHPEYGSLSLDKKGRQLTETVQFENNGDRKQDETVRQQALRYLEALTPKERAAMESVEIVFREKKPVRAVLKAGTGDLSPERLKELKRQAGL
jgi:uncharacterized protein YnzC (UPF0291/DUF896 family)